MLGRLLFQPKYLFNLLSTALAKAYFAPSFSTPLNIERIVCPESDSDGRKRLSLFRFATTEVIACNTVLYRCFGFLSGSHWC
jgi:hypothetical protein